jgi:hypothetical protein
LLDSSLAAQIDPEMFPVIRGLNLDGWKRGMVYLAMPGRGYRRRMGRQDAPSPDKMIP